MSKSAIKSKKTAKVYLVGAGPGDPGLITVRGSELLALADVIVYDFLANEEFLSLAGNETELIYVGKQAGKHSMKQEDINSLLVELAQAGKTVVRLKGGDPFIFGRGGEEALALAEAEIAFEIVPGVTSGAAVPAYCGIPVTHRSLATSVSFITGHEDPTKDQSQLNWQALATIGGTLVFYMGVKNLPTIAAELIKHGLAADTPCAVIANGTKPQQRTVTGPLANIASITEKAKIAPPALIVVGQVTSLREKLQWFENRPLSGKTIAITRAQAQASSLRSTLTELGAEVIEFPTIQIEPPDDIEPLEQAIIELYKYEWIVFTSVNGVEAFFSTLFELGLDVRRISKEKFCTIGPATAAKLREYGIIADLIPEKFIAESIADAFLARGGIAGKKTLLPRADIARHTLVELFEAMDAEVSDIAAYKTVPVAQNCQKLKELIADDKLDYITFTSSSTVKNFFEIIEPDKLKNKKTILASIGPITTKTINEYGLKPGLEAAEYTIDGLVAAILAKHR